VQAVKDQFYKCKYIFMQNRFIVPTLIALIFSATIVSFTFGERLAKIEKQDNYQILMEIRDSVNLLLKDD